MATMLDKSQTAKKVLPVFFLLDSSESMEGNPITTLNCSVEDLLPDLANFENSSVDIRISILTFNSETRWIVGENELPTPNEAQNAWQDLQASGMTAMGAAFQELNNKLSVSTLSKQFKAPLVAPLVLLFSDGEPTDDYRAGLCLLRDNKLFDYSIRVAIGYGDDCNYGILRKFTRNRETVFRADTLPKLKSLIRLTTLSSIESSVKPMSNKNEIAANNNTAKAAAFIEAQGYLNEVTDDEKWDDLPE